MGVLTTHKTRSTPLACWRCALFFVIVSASQSVDPLVSMIDANYFHHESTHLQMGVMAVLCNVSIYKSM